MSEEQGSIERTYEDAKSGNWGRVLAQWKHAPLFAQKCSRFQKASSGWTFLHQAAYFGHEVACRELIRLGAAVETLSHEGQTAADVAEKRKSPALAAVLRRSSVGSLWSAPEDPTLLPSSNLFAEAVERRASETMRVAYGGGIVNIPTGSRHFVDSFGRTLVGWHGSYDPPCGMDGESMLED